VLYIDRLKSGGALHGRHLCCTLVVFGALDLLLKVQQTKVSFYSTSILPCCRCKGETPLIAISETDIGEVESVRLNLHSDFWLEAAWVQDMRSTLTCRDIGKERTTL
jgi:hypothetical protein